MRIILLCALVFAMGLAQTPDAQIAFEVAAVKPSAPMGMGPMRIGTRGGPGTADPGRFTCERCTLAMLVSTAYDINYVQIAGPSWLREPEFDIAAKIPEGATKALFRKMMQNLLSERFKLTAHQEKRDLPIYEMTVAKKGASSEGIDRTGGLARSGGAWCRWAPSAASASAGICGRARVRRRPAGASVSSRALSDDDDDAGGRALAPDR